MILLKSGRDIHGRKMSLYESKRVADGKRDEMISQNVCAEFRHMKGSVVCCNS